MLARLAAYVKKHRHCNVPTNFSADPQLGRWVAAQRHRRKIGALSEAQIRQLDDLGFVWSPSDDRWEAMFERLRTFKKKYGHCNVPTHWPKDPVLADWVQRQRLNRRKKRLSGARIRRLDEIGFVWAIYKDGQETRTCETRTPVEDEKLPVPQESCERLYCISSGSYVQYGGKGKMPVVLEEYVKKHCGELPPYIPLPERPVLFRLGEGWKKPWTVRWNGRGRLPQEILAYVCEHGTLPPYE